MAPRNCSVFLTHCPDTFLGLPTTEPEAAQTCAGTNVHHVLCPRAPSPHHPLARTSHLPLIHFLLFPEPFRISSSGQNGTHSFFYPGSPLGQQEGNGNSFLLLRVQVTVEQIASNFLLPADEKRGALTLPFSYPPTCGYLYISVATCAPSLQFELGNEMRGCPFLLCSSQRSHTLSGAIVIPLPLGRLEASPGTATPLR